MERFEGNHAFVGLFGVTGAFLLAMDAVLIVEASRQFSTFTMFTAAAGVFGLCASGAAGVFLLYAAREAGASFFVDDDGITRRAWGRATAIAWHDLVRIEEFSTTSSKGKTGASGRCVLYCAEGRRIAIPIPWMLDRRRLGAVLEPRFAPLREAELRDLARQGGRFRPDRMVGVLVLTFMTPMFLICGLTTFDSAAPGLVEWVEKWPYAGILLIAASAGLALLGAELVSRELVITADSIALKSLFLDRSIPFARVELISVKVIDAEEPGTDRLTVRGNDGQKIALDSSTPCYRAVLGLLHSRVDSKRLGSAAHDPDFC